MRLRAHVQLAVVVALLMPMAVAEALPGLDVAHAVGRLGAGASVAIVSDDADTLAALVREVAPEARILAAPVDADLAELDADVVLLDLPRDTPLAAIPGLATRALVVASTGDDALRHWGGPWRDADGDALLDFAAADDALEVELRAGVPFDARITWTSGAATDDYDLFLYDADLKTPLAWSNAYQADGAPASERIRFEPAADARGQLVVRAYAATTPARFSLLAPLLEHAVADGSALPQSLVADVLGVGAAEATAPHALLPATGRSGDAPILRAPAATSIEAAARVAGLGALLAGQRPELSPAALAAILGADVPDAADVLRRADTTAAAATEAVPSLTGPFRGGPVAVTLQFDDALAHAGGAALVLADGARVPLDVSLSHARTALAEGVIPADAADGRVLVEASGFRDWSGHAVANATFALDLLVDTTAPRVSWAPLPALVSSAFTIGWSVEDDTSGVTQTRLEALEDGAWRVADPSLAAAGTLTWTPTVDGTLRLRITARDAAGNSITSFSTAVEVDTTPPSIAPTPGGDPLTLVIGDHGAGVDPDSVEVTLDGAPVDHTTDESGIHAEPDAPLDPGYHELVVTAADAAGNPVTSTIGFFVPGADLDVLYPPAGPVGDATGPTLPPTLPPSVRGGAREIAVPESGPADDSGTAASRGMLEPPIPESPVLAATALAPAYDWQPPAMVLFFAIVMAAILYWRRASVASFGRRAGIFFANEWARILRAKWRIAEARWPKRLALHAQAFIVRMRWRRARRV